MLKGLTYLLPAFSPNLLTNSPYPYTQNSSLSPLYYAGELVKTLR